MVALAARISDKTRDLFGAPGQPQMLAHATGGKGRLPLASGIFFQELAIAVSKSAKGNGFQSIRPSMRRINASVFGSAWWSVIKINRVQRCGLIRSTAR